MPSDQPNEERPDNNLKRIASGIPRLDYILKGGFLEGGVYGILGTPGSGKTILGNQTCFNHVLMKQGRCVFMTLLTESHARMLPHLKSLSFFNPSYIPEQIFYISGYNTLDKEGLNGLLTLIRKTVQDHQANLLVIDGMENAAEIENSSQKFKRFIHDLQASMGFLRCTTLLLGSESRNHPPHPESPLLEGIIELSYRLIGPRAVRELAVLKLRGTDYLLGKHEVEIGESGMTIHPRTEIQFASENAHQSTRSDQPSKMKFGVEALDEMLHGGVSANSTTTLLGAPGIGKTVLGLSFLAEGARLGQSGVYFGFYEPPNKLLEKANAVGISLQKYMKAGLIEIHWQAPLEHFMDSLAEQVLEKFPIHPQISRRLFIDGIEGFRQAAIYPDRVPRFISAFVNQLRMKHVTTLISSELPLFKRELDISSPEVTSTIENIILLKYVEISSQVHRLISIMKMRESDYDSQICEFKITSSGIEVANSFDGADSILLGEAHGIVKNEPRLNAGNG